MTAAKPVHPDVSGFEQHLLAALVAERLLTLEDADRAGRACERAAGNLVEVIVRLGLCEERELARCVARVTAYPLFKSSDFPVAPPGRTISNPQFLREAKALPIAESGGATLVAVADPTNAFTAQALEMALGGPVSFVVAAASDIEDAIQRHYADLLGPVREHGAKLPANDIAEADFQRLREAANEAPIVRFVERMIARGIEARASDIHVEPQERRLRIRMRIDGVLRDEEAAPLSSAPGIVSRIKILARLDIAERRLPQDGAIKMNVRGREVDMRVATGPVAHGESIVVRILDRTSVELQLERLGFGDAALDRLAALLRRPSGIFLVTGPTGSGKSTTLYAGVNRLNETQRKIITIEDPVEFKIEGLNQFQVKPEIGFDFARALRSILRHDPDVIMVGEIRDGETARIAVQAALTGHLVLSTLHTNDAASAVTRLLDMGVEDYLVASTVSGVLAQRLVRRLCPQCRLPMTLPVRLAHNASSADDDSAERSVFRAAGCGACDGTGYRGRTVIFEMLTFDRDIRRAILAHEDAPGIRDLAIAAGMEPLFENGMARVSDGITTYDEVVRVAQDAASEMEIGSRHGAPKATVSLTSGFTLLELLIVLAILGLLAAIAAPRVMGYLERSKSQAAQLEVNNLAAALDLYRLDVGSYPGAADGLAALVRKPAHAKRWHGPYLNRTDSIIDPWGRPYIYSPSAGGLPPTILSLGADGKAGGVEEDEDIASPH